MSLRRSTENIEELLDNPPEVVRVDAEEVDGQWLILESVIEKEIEQMDADTNRRLNVWEYLNLL